MDLERRLSNLETLVNALIKRIDLDKMYNNADLNGQRQSISNITPYTETKTAYIGDTEVVFTPSTNGNLTVFVTDSEGNIPSYTVSSTEVVRVAFNQPLECVTTVTISIN